MSTNGRQDPQDKMVEVMERIASDLEKLLSATIVCGAILAAILFVMILRTLIGV